MKLLVTLGMLLLSATSAFAQDTEGSIVSLERPVDVATSFNESDLSKAWIKEFHYVVVINKANSGSEAQTIKVYEYGQLIISDIVSTGRDAFEAKGEHKSKRDSWSVTPTGYYTPTFLDKDHRSSAYGGIFSKILGGVKMPYAMFFNGDIALHQAPKGTERELGKKASGGCIRLKESVASDLFTRLTEVQGARIPNFNVDGSITLDSKGNYSYKSSKGFSALIIVKNEIKE